VIIFKSVGDRDEAFGVLSNMLGKHYCLESHTPGKWAFLGALAWLIPALFFGGLSAGLGLAARELETSGDWGADADALSAMIHAIVGGICGLLGSTTLFAIAIGIASLSVILCLYSMYVQWRTPPGLQTEQCLRNKNLDYIGSREKPA
jgi:hypothetical protein